MVVTEFYLQRTDGVKLYRTYSTMGYYIERDGVIYEEAIDPEHSGRNYTETNEKIPREESPNENIDYIDYNSANFDFN